MKGGTKARKAAGAPQQGREAPYDHGPPSLLAAGQAVVVDAADPAAPNRTIRRARRVWAPDVLLAQGAIDQSHHHAARRYHDAYAVGIMGARDRLTVYVDRAGAPRGFSEAQLFAATDYRKATQAAGQQASPLLAWCVLSYGSVAGWAQCKGWDARKAQGYLLAALDRLVDHYGLR